MKPLAMLLLFVFARKNDIVECLGGSSALFDW